MTTTKLIRQLDSRVFVTSLEDRDGGLVYGVPKALYDKVYSTLISLEQDVRTPKGPSCDYCGASDYDDSAHEE